MPLSNSHTSRTSTKMRRISKLRHSESDVVGDNLETEGNEQEVLKLISILIPHAHTHSSKNHSIDICFK